MRAAAPGVGGIDVKLMDWLPLWALFVLTVGAALAAAESGFHLGRLWQGRSPGERGDGVGPMLVGTLTLLAFLLAFVTSMEMGRFDTRRQVLVQEANAIGTTDLRAGYLDEPYRSEIHSLLLQYVEVRLKVGDPQSMDQANAESVALHGRLWKQAEALARANPQSLPVSLLIASLNETIDMHATRQAAVLATRLPTNTWLLIFAVAFLTMRIVGFHSGLRGGRNLIALAFLILAFSAVLLIIADLERPYSGAFHISMQPLLDLQLQMSAGAP
jgi:hypothetical protein